MSDRDKARKLAEEIVRHFTDIYREGEGRDWTTEDAEDVGYVESRLRAFLAEREAATWDRFRRQRDWLQTQMEIYSRALRRLAEERRGNPAGVAAQEALDTALAYMQPVDTDGGLSQLHRALGEGAGLREALQEILKDAPGEGFEPDHEWTGNADDSFEEGSKMSHAWCADIARAALASCPLSERAGGIVQGVLELRRLGRVLEDSGHPDDIDRYNDALGEYERVMKAIETDADALRAELGKGGEGG